MELHPCSPHFLVAGGERPALALPAPRAVNGRVVHLATDLDPYEAFEESDALFRRAVDAWNECGPFALVPHRGHLLTGAEAFRLARDLDAAAFEAMAHESFALNPAP